jgi:outer membrane lipoprotein SlyB
MKKLTNVTLAAFAATALLASSVAAHAQDQPKPKGGTMKGAAVGAVAGHVMGGHAVAGAAAGAVIGHHEKAKSEKRISKGEQP